MRKKRSKKTLIGAAVLGWGSLGLAGYSLYKKEPGYSIAFFLISVVTWLIEISEMKGGD